MLPWNGPPRIGTASVYAPLYQLVFQDSDTNSSAALESAKYTVSRRLPSTSSGTRSTAGSSSTGYNVGWRPANKSASSGVIAGAVVGGVAGLAIVVALIVLLLRYRRRRLHEQQPSGNQNEWQKPEMSAGEDTTRSAVVPEIAATEVNELPGDHAHEAPTSFINSRR